MKISRVVLCRPLGGLNDVLCQIGIVCRYAEKFDRSIIVDTNHHSTSYIKDHFSRYFISKQERLVLNLIEVESKLKNVGVVPHFLSNDLLRYDVKFDWDRGYFVESNTGQPVTFDFTKDYTEPLLVHHMSGRQHGASLAALSKLRLQTNLRDELTKRLSSINSNYVAVHIRNTDYKTNYQSLLNQLKHHNAMRDCENLFVATDDIACLEYCRHLFTGINVISFSKLPQESGLPIHRLSERDDIYERNKDAILDLLMLALSRNLFFLEINQNQWGARYSGFSILALDLRNSATVLKGLIEG